MAETELKKQTPGMSNVKPHAGGCHCGAVRFEADLDLSGPASRCNCTICTKVGATSVIVKPSAFRLLSGAESLSEYRVGKSPNSRSFCKHCGIQCFGAGYVEQIGGDFRSVNLNCLDDIELSTLTLHYWDGRHNNWEAGPRSTPWPVRA
jgi:hypothetical protein